MAVFKLNSFQRWALLTTGATYLLIGIGGLVRAAGAGLGCPDWPRCYGQWIPPTSASGLPPGVDPSTFNAAKTWLEYINRMIGVVIGLLIFWTLVLAIRRYRHRPRVLWPTVAAFLLVGFEGWLGGQVVLTELMPMVLSAHLACALVIVSLLLYATVCAFFDEDQPRSSLSSERLLIGRGAMASFVLVLVQVALGAVVRGHVQIASKAVPAIPRGEWLVGSGATFGFHRAFSVVAVLAIGALVWRVLDRSSEVWLRRAAVVTGVLVIVQVAAGLGLSQLDLPPALQVVHLWTGSMLMGGLTVIALLAWRLAPAPPGSSAAPSPAPV